MLLNFFLRQMADARPHWASLSWRTQWNKWSKERTREKARNGEIVRVFYLMWKKDIGMMEKSA